MVKASEFKNVCKAVNDRKLAELKKEIIEILKKQDEKDFKKAIDYFESQELHFTHLEKSLVSGKWIEKAGYGVGTVRIWKGKKYKKIAPGKWARVFDKEGRGTNIAIGKLIARVNKIDNAEGLLQFVMENKQRFVDENGVDLPVLNKLRAAVDARNGNVGSKEKTVEDKIKENPDYPFKPKTDKERAERAAFEKDRDDFIERMDKIRQENKKKDSKPAEKEEELSWKEKFLIATDEGAKKELGRGKMYKKHITDIQRIANSNINDIPEKLKTLNDFIEYQDSLSNPDYKQAGKDYARLKNHELAREIWQKVDDGEAEWDDNGYLKLNEHGLLAKPEKKEESETYWIQDFEGNRITSDDAKKKIKGIKDKLEYMESMKEGRSKDIVVSIDTSIRQLENYRDDLISKLNPEDRKEVESEVKKETEKTSKIDKEAAKEKTEDKEQKKIDMQMQLLELNKNRQDNNKNIKKLNSKLAELKQKKAEDESRGNSVDKYDKEIKDTQKEIDNLLDDNDLIESKGTKIAKELNQMEKDGVKKSMFDDFVIDMFIDDEIEDEEELKAGETEYNDYSAEQPELFNSTSMKVREALDRIRNQVL